MLFRSDQHLSHGKRRRDLTLAVQYAFAELSGHKSTQQHINRGRDLFLIIPAAMLPAGELEEVFRVTGLEMPESFLVDPAGHPHRPQWARS